MTRQVVGEREDQRADDRHQEGCTERLSDEDHEAHERHKTENDDGQLQSEKGIRPERTERCKEDLEQKEAVGISEQTLGRVKEGRAAPGLCASQSEEPLFVRVRDEAGVPLISHDAIESARPLGEEEDEGTEHPRPDDDRGVLNELACHRPVRSASTDGPRRRRVHLR